MERRLKGCMYSSSSFWRGAVEIYYGFIARRKYNRWIS
jgi:hypothetical protein